MNLPRKSCWLVLFFALTVCVQAQTNLTVRVMAANITSGNYQSYETAGINIFQGLKPDIVAVQEFRYNASSSSNDLRTLVNTAFGTNFNFYCEPGYNIPNGIISRYPISAAGSLDDPTVNDRGIAWARIDLPGTNHLYVISVHLYGSGTASDRNTEAMVVTNFIATNCPPNAWVIVGGDFNTGSRTEACVTTLKTKLSDEPVPDDNGSPADQDTNEPRNKPYDYVLASFALTNYLTPVTLPSHTLPHGLVFDSAVYTPLSDVSPVTYGDSHVNGMQHMAVIKDFLIGTNSGGVSPVTNPPSITSQPQSQSVFAGQSATFSVTVTGTAPLDFQWRFNGTNISGATTNPLVIPNAQSDAVGNYSVVITNVAGSVTSSVAALTVLTNSSGGLVVAQWNFNSVSADADTTTGTSLPSIGNGIASLVGGTTLNGSGFATGDSTSDPAGGTDNSAWNTTSYPASTSNNKTAGVQFAVSTVGWQNIAVSWSQQSSKTGSKYFRMQYSTNGGAVFSDFPVATVLPQGTTFYAFTNGLSDVAGVNNNPNFVFRVVAEFESTATGAGSATYVAAQTTSTYATTGTTRFDMVTVSGTAYSPATSATLTPKTFANGQLTFGVTGSPGANYIVLVSTNLSAPNWTPIHTNASPFDFTETNMAGPQKFYRAVAQ